MTQPTSTAARFVVRGKVQGVGFRAWVYRQAVRLELSGSVRNLANGAVQVDAEGSATAMDELRRLLHTGSPGSRVADVRTTPLPLGAVGTRFEIETAE